MSGQKFGGWNRQQRGIRDDGRMDSERAERDRYWLPCTSKTKERAMDSPDSDLTIEYQKWQPRRRFGNHVRQPLGRSVIQAQCDGVSHARLRSGKNCTDLRFALRLVGRVLSLLCAMSHLIFDRTTTKRTKKFRISSNRPSMRGRVHEKTELQSTDLSISVILVGVVTLIRVSHKRSFLRGGKNSSLSGLNPVNLPPRTHSRNWCPE